MIFKKLAEFIDKIFFKFPEIIFIMLKEFILIKQLIVFYIEKLYISKIFIEFKANKLPAIIGEYELIFSKNEF